MGFTTNAHGLTVFHYRLDFTDTLTVLVGQDEKPFLVHTAYICKTSGFFAKAYSHGWKEDRERIVRLPEADVELFQAYLYWTYTGNLEVDLPPPLTEGNTSSITPVSLYSIEFLSGFVSRPSALPANASGSLPALSSSS